MHIQDLAHKISAKIFIPESCAQKEPDISSVASLDKAEKEHASFFTNPAYLQDALKTKAGALIVAKPLENCSVLQLVHANPYWAFAKVSQHFFKPNYGPEGVSEQAFVGSGVTLGEGVRIFPNVYIGKDVVIGKQVTLFPGVYIGDCSIVGDETVIHANVSVESRTIIGKRCLVHAGSILGADGFGFAPNPPSQDQAGDIAKIPQVGCVVLEDDVEVGANCTIDRAALGETRIGTSTKLDAHVHVGHNAKIGHHTMIAGLTAIAGSATIGNWVIIGGQVGVAGHITVGDGVILGSRAGATKNLVSTEEPYLGMPAIPASHWRRMVVNMRRLVKRK